MEQKNTVQKKLLLVFLLLPVLLFVMLLLFQKPIVHGDERDTVTVVMTDGNGNVFEFSSEDAEQAQMISLLDLLLSSEEKADVEQQILLNTPDRQCYSLTRTVNGRISTNYRLYFFEHESGMALYFQESSRMLNIRKASGEVLQRFLETEYAASLFNNERTPVMVLSTGENVMPSEVLWYYRYADELVAQKDVIAVAQEIDTYAISGVLSLSLTPTPTQSTVTIIGEQGSAVFNGTLQELEQQRIDVTETMSVSVRATWQPSDNLPYSGIVNYQFNIQHIEPADFTLNTDVTNAGGLLRITGVNITNPERISCVLENASEELTYAFYPLDNTVFGYLVLPEDLIIGEYTLKISYGTYTKRAVVFVKAKSIDPMTYEDLDASVEIASLKQSLLQERILMQKRASEVTSILFPHDNWLNPTLQEDCTLLSHKGMVVVARPSNESFVRDGNRYLMPHGARIGCISGGIVLETGYNAYDGYYVLVDHGGGVVSCYGNVAQTIVQKGQILRAGDVVALAGASGLSGSDGFVLTVMLQGTPISPDALWE